MNRQKSPISRIKSARRCEDTVLRLAGDLYTAAMTWTSDDRQLVAVIDGAGWPELRDEYYTSRLFGMTGGPEKPVIDEVATYPDVTTWDFIRGGAPYFALNALAVDGRIYQYMSTENSFGPNEQGKWGEFTEQFTDANFTHAKLIYSPDNGRTWCNQDGSTPVRLESRKSHSHDNMVFYREPQDVFSHPSFLQMGKDYRDNRDGYVYVYAPNGRSQGTMNQLTMFRVPKKEILKREAYEYFSGLRGDGDADWVKDINARGVVHTFPGYRIPEIWPLCWLPSVAYNAALGVYMMVNCSGISADCIAPDPTYFGIWVAENPWGPWHQIHEEKAWTPAGDPKARAAGPVIAPQWIAQDGKSFWLVWTDVQQAVPDNLTEPMFRVKTHEEWLRVRLRWRLFYPYYAFNAQRVDLVFE